MHEMDYIDYDIINCYLNVFSFAHSQFLENLLLRNLGNYGKQPYQRDKIKTVNN